MSRAFLPVAILVTVLSLASCGGSDSNSSNAQVEGTTSGQQGPTAPQPGATGSQQTPGTTGTTAPGSGSKPSRKKSQTGAGSDGGATGAAQPNAQQEQKNEKGSSSPNKPRSKKVVKGPLTPAEQRKIVDKAQLRESQATACRALGTEFIAKSYGVGTTEIHAVAEAYARAFVKRAKAFPYKPIYQGCLRGLREK
jgi:hypothetical protein